jgi:hypothetical protein
MLQKTAFIVGAGAVENAWQPVIRAIQPYFSVSLSEDSANCFLARLVYVLRFWALSPGDVAKKQLEQQLQTFANIRVALSEELRAAEESGELRVRPQFAEVVDKLLITSTTSFSFILINTNWDMVIDRALEAHLAPDFTGQIYPLHIHGSVTDPSTLYLPTEVTKEPYRSKAEEQSIGGIHSSIMWGLESATRLLIYGLSVSPLDAELMQTLAAGIDCRTLREIVIVVPDHELVARRVKLLLDREPTIRVTGHHPNDLSAVIDYTNAFTESA